MKLTIKQKRFADEYIISGSLYQSAIEAGYSENYARKQAHKLLANVGIKTYINKRLKELDDKKIAKQEEVLKYLSSVIRDEQIEEVLRLAGDGGQTITEIKLSAKDKIKAAELLGKRYGLFSENVNLNADLDVNIKVDYGE